MINKSVRLTIVSSSSRQKLRQWTYRNRCRRLHDDVVEFNPKALEDMIKDKGFTTCKGLVLSLKSSSGIKGAVVGDFENNLRYLKRLKLFAKKNGVSYKEIIL